MRRVAAGDQDEHVPGSHRLMRRLAGFDPVWVTESFEVSLDGSVVILSSVRPGGTVMIAENVPYVTPPRAP